MYIGTSAFLIALGAILRFAVTTTISGFDIQMAGVILMVVGIIALLVSIAYLVWWSDRRREAAPREPRHPGTYGQTRERDYA